MFNLLMLMNIPILVYWLIINVYFDSKYQPFVKKPTELPMYFFVGCFNTDNANALIRGYKSFVRPLLEYCSTVWNPFIHAKYYLGMTDELENIQRYFTRRLYYRCRLDCNHGYLERINNPQLESLELRRIYNDMTMVFKIVHKFLNLNESDLLTMCNTTHN